jgi:hypothetical protein
MRPEPVIFIVGVGRSGTTLLQGMLNAHKDIAFPPETHFVREFLANPRINRLLQKKKFQRVRDSILASESLKRLNLDLAAILEVCTCEGQFTLVNFYRELLDVYRRRKNKRLIGDKDPKNVEYLLTIKEYFPEAFIIHLIRDPRDLILSRMKAEWSKGRPFLSHIAAYREQLKKGRKEGVNYFGGNYYELRYEDLISNPQHELKDICRRLGVEYDPGMLSYPQTAMEIIKGAEIRWKENCFKPVMAANMEKWPGNLSRRQVSLIEKICRLPFGEYGYRESGYLKGRNIFYKMIDQLLYIAFYGVDLVYALYHRLRLVVNRKYQKSL